MEKIFLKICLTNEGVELQVILQPCNLELERGKYDEKGEKSYSELSLKLCGEKKDGVCNLNQTRFMNVDIFIWSFCSLSFQNRTLSPLCWQESLSLLPLSKILQIKEDMGFGTLFCLFVIHNGALFQVLKMVLCNSTKLRL